MNPISEYYSRLGKKSAKAREKKFGNQYYRDLAKRSVEKRHQRIIEQSIASSIRSLLFVNFAS